MGAVGLRSASCHVLSCDAMSCYVMACYAVPWHGMAACHVMSWLGMASHRVHGAVAIPSAAPSCVDLLRQARGKTCVLVHTTHMHGLVEARPSRYRYCLVSWLMLAPDGVLAAVQ